MTDRTCIVTRKIFAPEAMLRFVCSDTNHIFLDIYGKLPGRGAWVLAERDIVKEAIKTKAFARSFKRPVIVDDILPDITDDLLRKSALSMLNMARKAGGVINGGMQIEKAIKNPRLFLILHSENAAQDGKRKIANACKCRKGLNLSNVLNLTLFTSENLSQVFGNKCVMHIGLFDSPIAKNFLCKAKKLQSYRDGTIRNTAFAVKE